MSWKTCQQDTQQTNVCVYYLPWHPRCPSLHPCRWCRTWCTGFFLLPALRSHWNIVWDKSNSVHTHGSRSKTNLFKQRRWSCALLKYVKIRVRVVHYYFTSCIFSPDLMLFLCRVFRSFSVLWVSEARRSRFWKRSLALMPFWAACLGTSSLPPNVKLPLALSYTNSTG